nr:hypothetical protein ORM20_00170 [Ochrobactrum phage ORM_20]
MEKSNKLRTFIPDPSFIPALTNLLFSRRFDIVTDKVVKGDHTVSVDFRLGTTSVMINLSNYIHCEERIYELLISYNEMKSFIGEITESEHQQLLDVLPEFVSSSYEDDFDKIFDENTRIK